LGEPTSQKQVNVSKNSSVTISATTYNSKKQNKNKKDIRTKTPKQPIFLNNNGIYKNPEELWGQKILHYAFNRLQLPTILQLQWQFSGPFNL